MGRQGRNGGNARQESPSITDNFRKLVEVSESRGGNFITAVRPLLLGGTGGLFEKGNWGRGNICC